MTTGKRPPEPTRWCDGCGTHHAGACPLGWNAGRLPATLPDMRGGSHGRHTHPIRPFDRGTRS